MDQSEIVVSFNLDVDEARRQTAALEKTAAVTKASFRVQILVAVVWFVVGIMEVATDHTKANGWFYLIGGCLYVFMALGLRSRIIKVPAGVETRIRFGSAAIVVESPVPQTLSWSAVEGVDTYAGGAIVIRFFASEIEPPLEQRILIPKDAFPDGGIAFWHLCEQMLLGPLRRVSAQLWADETGALRRTDATHIENSRARLAYVRRRRLPARSVSQS